MNDDIREKLGSVQATAKAAHQRLDRLETGLREDLSELNKELKELNAYMHKGKGYAAAFMLLSGLLGTGIFKLVGLFFTTKP